MADEYKREPIRAIRIPDDLWQRAREVSTERGESISKIVRDGLERYVKRHSS